MKARGRKGMKRRNDKQLLRNKQNGISTCGARIEQRRTQGIKEVLMKIMIRLSSQSCVIVNILLALLSHAEFSVYLFIPLPTAILLQPEVFESVFVYFILSESIHARIDYFHKLHEQQCLTITSNRHIQATKYCRLNQRQCWHFPKATFNEKILLHVDGNYSIDIGETKLIVRVH